MALKNYITYTHTDRNISTVGAFINNQGLSIVKGIGVDRLLEFGITFRANPSNDYIAEETWFRNNQQNIINEWDWFEREAYLDSDGSPRSPSDPEYRGPEAWPLKYGTILWLPKAELFIEPALIAGFNQSIQPPTARTFMAKQLYELLNAEDYYPITRTSIRPGEGLNQLYPNVSVWIWCRALSSNDTERLFNEADELPDFVTNGAYDDFNDFRRKMIAHFGMQGNVIDASPFVQDINTSVDGRGGNFSIKLAPIEGEEDALTGWKPKGGTIDAFNDREFVSQSRINKFALDKDSEGYMKRMQYLLHYAIQPNDVVFIRFETLEMEKDDRVPTDEWEFIVDKAKLAEKNYDMIGLIDQNKCSMSPNPSTADVEIIGRDLSKLYQEDGSYFYPLAYTNYAEPGIGDLKLVRRLSTTGKYPLFGEHAYRSIRFSVEFITNQVSNITITPDNLFTSYGDRVSKTLQMGEAQKASLESELERLRETAVYNIGSSRIKDGINLPINSPEESAKIVEVFETMLRFCKDVVQNNKVAYESTTYKARIWFAGTYAGAAVSDFRVPELFKTVGLYESLYDAQRDENFVNRQGDEFDGVQVGGKVVSDEATDAIEKTLQYAVLLYGSLQAYEPLPMPGIWQIIRFVYGPNVDELRIADGSISQPDGDLYGQIRKFCQEPLVEFFGDTYGDFYYFTIRRPQWDRETVYGWIDNYVELTDDFDEIPSPEAARETRRPKLEEGINLTIKSRPTNIFPLIIEIFDDQVVSESLNFFDGEIYSFFEVAPQAGFLGQGSEVSTGYIPIITLPEYAEVWGCKRYKLIDQYVKFDGHWRLKSLQKTNVIEQSAADMAYLVDINQYLPFTRQGTITIEGDRRIKRGSWIYYKPTNEIFYVTGVQQNYSTGAKESRRTTLQVERGMVRDFVEKRRVLNEFNEPVDISYFDIVDTERIRRYIELFAQDMEKAGKLIQGIVNKDAFNFFLKRNQFKNYDNEQ